MSELMKPQPTYAHEDVKNIIEDVAQSSAMRLDPASMDKLWDLITMVFKWQLTMSSDIVKLTSRHLYEIESYVNQPETQLQLQRVQNLIDNFAMTINEQHALREEILDWHKNFHVRVSLLLKLGLQANDGTFIVNNQSTIAQDMLKNLGENIYAVTQNGKILEKDGGENQLKRDNEGSELKLFVNQILGERKEITNGNEKKQLRLAIKNKNEPCPVGNRNGNFDQITVDMQDNNLHDIFGDMNINEDVKVTNFTDDLLDMIGND